MDGGDKSGKLLPSRVKVAQGASNNKTMNLIVHLAGYSKRLLEEVHRRWSVIFIRRLIDNHRGRMKNHHP